MDPLDQLPASAPCEIVRSARAFLKNPTRPVTPADGGRRLLQSTSYANRPSTPGDLISSRAFLCENDLSISSPSSSITEPTSTTRPIAAANKAEVLTADPAPHHNGVASSQQYVHLSSRKLSTLPGALPSLRSSSSNLSKASNLQPTAARTTQAAASARADSSSNLDSTVLCVSDHAKHVANCDSAISQRGLSEERSAAETEFRPVTPAEECPRLLEGNTSSTRSSRACSASSQSATDSSSAAASCSGRLWQQEVLQAVRAVDHMMLSPNPADSTALLVAAAGLQTCLDVAEDQQRLQEWLDAPVQEALGSDMRCARSVMGVSAMATPANAAAAGKAANSSMAMLRAVVVACLIRLVDCRTADVLVKAGSMMLRVIPATSKMLLTTAKMLYKLSKARENDAKFRHHGVLRPLLSVIASHSSLLHQLADLQLSCQQQRGTDRTPVSTAAAAAAAGASSTAQQQQQQHSGLLLVYLIGCLKNVSADTRNQACLGRLGAVTTMSQVIDLIPSLQPKQHQQYETSVQACVQATAVLRNLAVAPAHAQYFIQQDGSAVHALLHLLSITEYEEVTLNISRILSKLSLHSCCTQVILQYKVTFIAAGRSGMIDGGDVSLCDGQRITSVSLLTRLTIGSPSVCNSVDSSYWAVVLRLAFVLGNLTTYHAEARQQVAATPEALVFLPQLVVRVLQLHKHEQEVQLQPVTTAADSDTRNNSSSTPLVDVLVKCIRLLANMALESSEGMQLASQKATVDAVMGVLGSFSYEDEEELVLNAAAALTNLAYHKGPSNLVLSVDAAAIMRPLLPLLTSSNDEAPIEAARAVSNLIQGSAAVRAEIICQPIESMIEPDSYEPDNAKDAGDDQQVSCRNSSDDTYAGAAIQRGVGLFVVQALVLLLGHSNWEVVAAVAGSLVNITATAGSAAVLCQVGFMEELKDVLTRAAAELQACNQQYALADVNATSCLELPAPQDDLLVALEHLLQSFHNYTVDSSNNSRHRLDNTAVGGTAAVNSEAALGSTKALASCCNCSDCASLQLLQPVMTGLLCAAGSQPQWLSDGCILLIRALQELVAK